MKTITTAFSSEANLLISLSEAKSEIELNAESVLLYHPERYLDA